MASPTPGYCTFTATALRPSRVMARWTWPIDAAAIGIGIPLDEHLLGRAAELARRPSRRPARRSSAARLCLELASASRSGSGRPSSR